MDFNNLFRKFNRFLSIKTQAAAMYVHEVELIHLTKFIKMLLENEVNGYCNRLIKVMERSPAFSMSSPISIPKQF